MRNRAFTLTELLVVVIVMGVLAAVAVPKFARVLENYRTHEAEEILSAVRTEQEARCTMGKPYLGEASRSKVSTLANAGGSATYDYELLNSGIAAHRGDDYTLRMWYKTGELCCQGDGCSDLSRTYPACTANEPEDECAAAPGAPEIPAGPNSCGEEPPLPAPRTCNVCGTQSASNVCNQSTWTWEVVWGDCSKESSEDCPKPTCSSLTDGEYPEGHPTCSDGECDINTCYKEVSGVPCSTATDGEYTIGTLGGDKYVSPNGEIIGYDVRDNIDNKCSKIEERDLPCSDSNMLGDYFGGTGHAEVQITRGGDILSAREQEYGNCYRLVYTKTSEEQNSSACPLDSPPLEHGAYNPSGAYYPSDDCDSAMSSWMNSTYADMSSYWACPTQGATCTVCTGHKRQVWTCVQEDGFHTPETGHLSQSAAHDYWEKWNSIH